MAREHARAFRDVEGVRLAGIYSRTESRARQLAAELAIEHVSHSVDDLYHRTHADIVVVTVNEISMVDLALQCMEYPWLVLLEKPPGLSVPEAEALAAAAEVKSRDVRVALNRQWYSTTQSVLRDLARTEGPRFIKVQDQENPAPALTSGRPARVAGAWMFANSIHMLDYFRLLARGEVIEVVPVLAWRPRSEPCLVVARIRFSSGDEGLYEAVWNGPGPWAVSVTVPGRRWELRPLEKGLSQSLGERPVEIETTPWDAAFKPGFRLQAEEVVALSRGRASSVATVEEALRTMRLIESIYPAPWEPSLS